jgi:hypothetical protein
VGIRGGGLGGAHHSVPEVDERAVHIREVIVVVVKIAQRCVVAAATPAREREREQRYTVRWEVSAQFTESTIEKAHVSRELLPTTLNTFGIEASPAESARVQRAPAMRRVIPGRHSRVPLPHLVRHVTGGLQLGGDARPARTAA